MRGSLALWSRGGTQGFFVVASLMALVLGALWWTRRLRAQQQQLETVIATRTEQLNVANARLVELSYTYALTGLANRRMLQKQLHELVERGGTASSSPSSLAFIDVDHFKDLNDRLGHPAGVEVLRTIAECLKAHAPTAAVVSRYGGEEFACLLPGWRAKRRWRLRSGCERTSKGD